MVCSVFIREESLEQQKHQMVSGSDTAQMGGGRKV